MESQLSINPREAFTNLPWRTGTINEVVKGDIFGFADHHLGFTAFGHVQHESISQFQPNFNAVYRLFMGVTLLCDKISLEVNQYYAFVPVVFTRSSVCRIISKDSISFEKILARLWIRVHLLGILAMKKKKEPMYTVGR
jgi:hypothetical protein